jgi:deoxyribodipyrimidine photo-lyase
MPTSLLWFRQDLRLADNPALEAAVARGAVVPVYVWAPEEEGRWAPGGAAKWWLNESLTRLDESLRARGSRLVIQRGPTAETLDKLLAETGSDAVLWNRRYEPSAVSRDARIKAALKDRGIAAESFNSALLFEPFRVKNGRGRGEPFRVFTPFWKAALATGEPEPASDAPASIPAPAAWPESPAVADLGLPPSDPRQTWPAGLAAAWTPGEAGASAALGAFLAARVPGYGENRDRPDLTGTSRLSPHLHWGELSPRQVWDAVHEVARPDFRNRRGSAADRGAEHFLREVGWREFAYYLLYHFPHTPERPLQPEFEDFPYERDPAVLRAWRKGLTGYPMVDAGMRELWATGWMHNRTRMVVASYLTKDLLHDWRDGAGWFWDTLVCADLAANTMGWQWAAGVGADPAQYVRIFHPVLQGVKNDPAGDYVRRWVPELAGLPAEHIHNPRSAPPSVLSAAGVRLGETYPLPLAEHERAKPRAERLYSSRMGLPARRTGER